MERKVIAGNRYKHFKGMIVEVLNIGVLSETLEKVVIYKDISNNDIWVRPYDMFNSLVDKEKYPNIKQKYRFELIKK